MGKGRNEKDTCRDLVEPMIQRAGWSVEAILPQYPVAARRVLHGDRSHRDLGDGFVDYVLEPVRGVPGAVLEAKREGRSPEDGLAQALRYAQQLDAPLAYASNGHRTILHDRRDGTERDVESVLTPAETWDAYAELHGLDERGTRLVGQPFNRQRKDAAGEVLTPRYYQTLAVHRVLRAIATGQRRVLLLMATGTGKTFTAMQIVAKLRSYEKATHPDRNYRVLYLADRDQLLTQPMTKDFEPAFGGEPLARVTKGADRSRELYFASYQALTGETDDSSLFEGFRPDFFDLVIVDECHRGSASQESSWRRVLDYFHGAVQLGLTATPVRDSHVDSYEYFGNPVFEYSLRDGIEDGYLAPYRVRRVVLSPDVEGWEPSPGEVDRLGREIPEGMYGTRDFERVVALLKRTRVAARHLSSLLTVDPNARTIVFCVDVDHADTMRSELVRANPEAVEADPEWVVRIVGVEGERQRLLEEFMDPTRDSPVVATTSKLLSTGVDIEDLKYVVLFRPIGSIVEFKQIIGRGTRLYPDKGKTSFEIVDYVGATVHFSDPDFDGYPTHIEVETIDGDGNVIESHDTDPESDSDDRAHVAEPVPGFDVEPGGDVHDPLPERDTRKFFVDSGDFTVQAEAIMVPDRSSGALRLTEYGEYVAKSVQDFGSAEELTLMWSTADQREQVLLELDEQHIDANDLVVATGNGDVDLLDALLHIAWNAPARTRSERARRAREQHATELAAMSAKARAVLQGLLTRYEDAGIDDVTSPEVLHIQPLRDLGSPAEIAATLGGPGKFREQVDLIQIWLYSA